MNNKQNSKKPTQETSTALDLGLDGIVDRQNGGVELTAEEMQMITGGRWFSDADLGITPEQRVKIDIVNEKYLRTGVFDGYN